MACISVCDVITKNSFLSSALVGIFGEGSVIPVLRLVSAIAEMGPETVHADLAQTGFLVPITDMLRDAVVGKRFIQNIFAEFIWNHLLLLIDSFFFMSYCPQHLFYSLQRVITLFLLQR